jgi:hypothetical protein
MLGGVAIGTIHGTREDRMSNQQWDVIVAGGGMGAVTAALGAAQQGTRTLIIERGGRLGGAATTCLVQPLMGWIRDRHPLVQDLLTRLGGESSKLHDLVLAEALLAAGVEVRLHTWCLDAVLADGRVTGVRVVDKSGLHALSAAVVVDATGDGDLAASAGVPFAQGRAGDGLMQPMTIMYEVGGVAEGAFCCGSEEAARDCRLPGGSWHDIVMAGRARGELPPSVGVVRIYASPLPGRRIINATQVNHVDGLSPADLTAAEIEGRRQARQVTAFLRAHAPGYADCHIAEMPAAIGVRETRRFQGLSSMAIPVMAAGRREDDAVVRETCFPVDIHNPDGVGQAAGERAAQVPPYDIPYGCLVPVNRDGLLLAGRAISGSHEAHASYRVQRITMEIGVAAGTAAALCARRGIAPRDLPARAVQEALGWRR